jgi:hypothetical protein
MRLKHEEMTYHIRPKGADMLRLKVKTSGNALKGDFRIEVLWVEQPYEVLDSDLRVIHSHPLAEGLGEQRLPIEK